MKKILFVCLENICRSPMAELILKDMVKKAGVEKEFRIDSAGIIEFNQGKPVYREARRKLAEHGIDCAGKYARQMHGGDYAAYDLLIGMDHTNLKDMRQICGGDPEHKICLLMDFTDRPGDVADPYYTGDFEAAWRDVEEGCRGLMVWLLNDTPIQIGK